jgi:L-threonylcarbamoyladenylate synthase
MPVRDSSSRPCGTTSDSCQALGSRYDPRSIRTLTIKSAPSENPLRSRRMTQPTSAELQQAAALLLAGKLVAFPTETVYGLGANALDADAIERIYAAKGRPKASPIIVHIASVEMARSLTSAWPESAQILADKFWPGPLTLVLPKRAAVPPNVTAGLDTVGIRIPAHPVALALIRAAGVPIAAPSANRFTELSPTTAEHVRRSLGDRVDMILDGGPCTVGIESTVVSLAGPAPVLLRPGGVTRAEIVSLLGPVSTSAQPTGAAHPSPGLHPRHYSPRTRLLIVQHGAVPPTGRGAYMQHRHRPALPVERVEVMPPSAHGFAARLYEILHVLDGQGYDWIAVDEVPSTPEWEAVRDRLKRAAAE